VSQERNAFIDGLRELADFLESNPDVKPTFDYYSDTVNFIVHTREEMAAIARIGHWEKVPVTQFFSIRRMFGPIQFDVFTERENVCRKVTAGTRVVPAKPAQPEREEPIEEWICDGALLAQADDAVEARGSGL
jgi:hypothetical protein